MVAVSSAVATLTVLATGMPSASAQFQSPSGRQYRPHTPPGGESPSVSGHSGSDVSDDGAFDSDTDPHATLRTLGRGGVPEHADHASAEFSRFHRLLRNRGRIPASTAQEIADDVTDPAHLRRYASIWASRISGARNSHHKFIMATNRSGQIRVYEETSEPGEFRLVRPRRDGVRILQDRYQQFTYEILDAGTHPWVSVR